MAELAAGAVNSLLGLIRNEALLLFRVRGDVRFIKDEMESMKSFLAHLARMTPPGGGHDEQVLTWMKQVEELAHDCRDCVIVLYLHHGDPEVYRAMGGIQRYMRWFPWFVRKMVDQHRAASRLVELKERARDISERRKRYDVEVPTKPSSSQAAGHVAATGALGYEDDDSDNEAATANDDGRRRLLEPRSVEDYCTEKLASWLNKLHGRNNMEGSVASIAIVAPDDDNIAHTIVHQAVALTCRHFRRMFWINQNQAQVQYYSRGFPLDILSYILHECEKGGTSSHIRDVQSEISRKIEEINIDSKIKNIVTKIEEIERMVIQAEDKKTEESKWLVPFDIIPLDEPLGVLQQALCLITMRSINLQTMGWRTISLKELVEVTAEMFKQYMEHEASEFCDEPPICLHISQYEYILRKVFPASRRKLAQVKEGNAPTALGQDKTNDFKEESSKSVNKQATGFIGGTSGGITNKAINASIKETNEKIEEMKMLQEGNPPTLFQKGSADDFKEETTRSVVNKQAIGILGGVDIGVINKDIAAAIRETKDNMEIIKRIIKEQMRIKGIVEKIEKQLEHKHTLIVLQDERDYISQWEEIINALSLLARISCASNAVVMVTRNSLRAKDYCYPQGEPIKYPLVDFYHDIVLQLTSEPKSEDDKKSHILHGILKKCDPDELCMKMLAHALYANPNRSYDELCRLHDVLQFSKDSLVTSNSTKMFKFSYNDLLKEYKSCLLYLAIFPQGEEIKRSTLVARWVIEGLISKEDWPSSVHHAEQCFDTLINRWFIYAADIGAEGKVKSCIVGDLVHGIISKIAKKEHIVDTRLSHHLAHHFSIFSGLQLRRSDSIHDFLQNLPKYSPQLLLVKVLDLEGCQFNNSHFHLKNICKKMLLLKYLSLRGTNVTHLPRQINNLHDLEILDIRQTEVQERETRHILLLKLRRLLAGGTDPSSGSNDIGTTTGKKERLCSSVQIPYKIEKMENIEVLSNVMASLYGNELKDIRKLWNLRKLGVVIKDNDQHLRNLLQVIGDLKERLQSLSITIPKTRSEDTSNDGNLLQEDIYNRLVHPPKLLESVSIFGLTNRVRLPVLLARGSNELAKVTLSGTMLLKEKYLKVLSDLPKLRCIRLQHGACKFNSLTFNEEEFEHLKCLLIYGCNMTDITFKEGAAAELEKIIVSSTNVRSLRGIGCLPNLKELELKGNESFISSNGDGGDPQENIELVSPLEGGVAPQKSTEHVSPGEDGTTPQISTTPPEDRAASWEEVQSKITFRKGQFQHLKYFLFEDSRMIEIIFEDGAAPDLEKITLSLTSKNSRITVFGSLPKLKEVKLKGDKSILFPLVNDSNRIDKVTLCDTLLNRDDLGILAMKMNICCLVLLDNSYDESQLTFNIGEFPKLNLLIVKCPKIKTIHFNNGSAPNLEKIVWSFTELESLSGINNVTKLKELELNGDTIPRQVRKDIKAHTNTPVLVIHEKEQADESWFQHVATGYFSKKKDQN